MSEKELEQSEKRFDRIRSFVLRAGRTTAGQQRALEELGPKYLITFQNAVLDLSAAFHGSTNPKILEIGFGSHLNPSSPTLPPKEPRPN